MTKRRRSKLPRGYKERADGRLEYRFTYQGKRYSVYGDTYKECEQMAKEKKGFIDRGYTKNKNITLQMFFEEWSAGRVGTVRESTAIFTENRWKKLKPYLGDMKVIDLETRKILQARAAMIEDGKICAREINRSIGVLSSLMKAAVDCGLREKNPCNGIRNLKTNDREPARETYHRALTIQETMLFLKATEASWYYELFCFLLSTGCRIGEAAALQWSDVDFKNNVVHITKTTSQTKNGLTIESTKTRSGIREIPLNLQALSALKRQKEKLDIFYDIIPLESNVFMTMHNKTLRDNHVNRTISHFLEKIAEKNTRIEYFSVHALRATFATRAIESGMNPKTLQEILGHSDIGMTLNLYAHCLSETKKKEMKLVELGFVV